MTSSPAKPSTESATINDLPAEMIAELFKHLSPKDLIACSTVSKRWYSIHGDIRLECLAVTPKKAKNPYSDKWSHSGREIVRKEMCHPNLFICLANRPLLTNLKCLAIFLPSDFPAKPFEFDLDELNKFTQLVQLEISMGHSKKEKVNLCLPKLNVLAVRSNYADSNHHIWSLSVDCPALSVLVYKKPRGDYRLDVKHPETIRKLETNLVGENLAQFQGVECLVTQKLEAISLDTLLTLPNLKELHFNQSIIMFLFFEYSNHVGSVDRLKATLSEFLDVLQVLKGSDFRFTFAGFRLTKSTLELMDFGVEEHETYERVFSEHLYMKNRQLIDPDVNLDFVLSFNYSRLMHVAGGEIPSWFFQRFANIQGIEASRPVRDLDHFGWFLSSSRTLHLQLDRAWLDQDFYDQLPTLTPLLTSLELVETAANELQLNFDFVEKLPHLSTIEFRQRASLESVTSLVGVFSKSDLISIAFKWSRNRVHIYKSRSSKLYELKKYTDQDGELYQVHMNPKQEPDLKTDSSDEILNYLKDLLIYWYRDVPKEYLISKGPSSYLSRPVGWLRSFFNKSYRGQNMQEVLEAR